MFLKEKTQIMVYSVYMLHFKSKLVTICNKSPISTAHTLVASNVDLLQV